MTGGMNDSTLRRDSGLSAEAVTDGAGGPVAAAAGAVILVVEDEPTINRALADRLTAEGFVVHRAWDGPGAVTAFETHRPDLVVLDLMLPGFDGLEVCRRIQAQRAVPVLMVTARDDETDILVGLGVGADDYLTKPFRMREVVARVRALLRRVDRAHDLASTSGPSVRPVDQVAETTLVVGPLVVDTGAHRVRVAGVEVHLTPTEFDLLTALARSAGAVCRREALLRGVWGWEDTFGTRTLDSHIKTLRAKVGPHRIRTVHGVGYALEVGS